MMYLKRLSKEILKCLKYACLISSILVIISALVGVIISKANWIGTLECIKATLFIIGSIGLFIGAITICLKGSSIQMAKQRDGLDDADKPMEEWNKKFRCLSFKWAIVIVSFVILLYGCIVDQILFVI